MIKSQSHLQRELGVFGATMMGLGSIVGTGVFVSIGIATGIAGSAVILAIGIGAIVAICNGLSSAQLAANHPTSGGSYEYGYKYLSPAFGFIAGWMFLLAKTASAATAALGFAGYLINIIGWSASLVIPIALLAVGVMILIVLNGIKRSNLANTVIVSITLLSLGFFILACFPRALQMGTSHFTPFFTTPTSVLHATALMFVSYTGYGRIATLGEEVRSPRQSIPKAIIISLILVMLLYITVAVVGIGAVGVDILGNATQQTSLAPLEVAARSVAGARGSLLLGIGAMTAMLGVLLNLVLGLSRVLLAMGRRGDAARILARLNSQQTTPSYAVIAIGVVIAILVLLGNVKTTWSFSAFSVLIYYAITNLATLRLSQQERLYPKWVGILGLCSCLFLAFWVDSSIWQIGLGLIVAGLIWHKARQKR